MQYTQGAICKRNMRPHTPECRARLLEWLNRGGDIDADDPDCRTQHMNIIPGDLPVRSEEQLELDRVRIFGY